MRRGVKVHQASVHRSWGVEPLCTFQPSVGLWAEIPIHSAFSGSKTWHVRWLAHTERVVEETFVSYSQAVVSCILEAEMSYLNSRAIYSVLQGGSLAGCLVETEPKHVSGDWARVILQTEFLQEVPIQRLSDIRAILAFFCNLFPKFPVEYSLMFIETCVRTQQKCFWKKSFLISKSALILKQFLHSKTCFVK